MNPVSPGPFTGLPPQSARPAAVPPTAPAPPALSAPVAVTQPEWSGAVRPPDALLRALRPDLLPKADAEVLTGPPPSFLANVLDLLPDSMTPAEDDTAIAPQAAGPEPTTPEPAESGTTWAEAAGPLDADWTGPGPAPL